MFVTWTTRASSISLFHSAQDNTTKCEQDSTQHCTQDNTDNCVKENSEPDSPTNWEKDSSANWEQDSTEKCAEDSKANCEQDGTANCGQNSKAYYEKFYFLLELRPLGQHEDCDSLAWTDQECRSSWGPDCRQSAY